MKKTSLLTIITGAMLAWASAGPAAAQTPPGIQWQRSFGGDKNDAMTVVKPTSDGGYFLGGYASSGATGNKTSPNYDTNEYWYESADYWLVKVDAHGDKQWEKVFGGTSDDRLIDLELTSDGGCLLGGYSNSNVSGNKTATLWGNSNDYWIVKVDANGKKQWDQSFGGTSEEFLFDLQITSDGGYILGGYSDSGASGNKTSPTHGERDAWVVKVDANGSKQWERSFGGSNYDGVSELRQTSDGGYILGGYSASGVSGNKTSAGFGSGDYWVVKINANGEKQWERSYGGTDNDRLDRLHPTSDGGYILGGNSVSGVSGNKTSTNLGNDDYWIVKVDANGRKQWDRSFGGSDLEFLFALQVTSDGGCILGGLSNSGVSGNKTTPNFGAGDYWVVKVAANGNQEWERTFGGSSDEILLCLQETSDGGYILGGRSRSAPSGNKISPYMGGDPFWANDYWVVKLGPPPLRFHSYSLASNSVFQAQLGVLPGASYVLQASTNLIDWTALQTNQATNDYMPLSDTNAPDQPRRFYRAREQP